MAMGDGVGARIKEERERMGFEGSDGEKAFARKLSVSRQCVKDMEAGKNPPESKHLWCFVQNGLDINYVLTGHYLTPPEEAALLKNYRAASQKDKAHMRRLALRLRNRSE